MQTQKGSHTLKKLYVGVQHPYYVVAPDYARQSAGIRVMHQFCAALRRCGQEAWISTGKVNPELDTPLLTDEIRHRHAELGRIPIAVYPEVIGGNPLQAHVVTRYILNTPGLFGESPRYKSSDFLFSYAEELNIKLTGSWGVLFLPCIDSSVFNNLNNPSDGARDGWCVYAGRYKQGLIENQELLANCKVITREWPGSHEEMADLFRQSEGLYCFENTAVSLEARLCGCPVVHLPSPFYNTQHLMGTSEGLTLGTSSSNEPKLIAAAKAELPNLSAAYEALEWEFWHKLDKWIEDTQALACDVAKTPPGPLIDDTPADDPAYRAWYQLNAPGELQAQHLATRMVHNWTEAPSVHLFMPVCPGEMGGYMQTMPSLEAQVYGNWMLTVATTEPAPTSVENQPRIQWLQARDESHLDLILHEMAKVSGGEWLGFLAPGIALDALGLQALLDAAQEHPSWQLVYGDDDIQSNDGRSYHPRLKPNTDLITLCGASFLDGLALVRKSAYTTTLPAGGSPHLAAYAVALELLAAGERHAIGHVNGVWAHLPEKAAADASDSELQTVKDQLHRVGIEADIQPRVATDLRLVQPVPPLVPQAVTAVLLGADTLEATLAQWRHLLTMTGARGLQTCLIANRMSSPTDAQLLRTAVSVEQALPTATLDLQGLSEGEALATLCMQIPTPLAWIFGPTTLPLQADGLIHLAAWLEWPSVAAVQPGLWDMTTKHMLSPGFAPGLTWERMVLSPDTIDNTPTQQRSLASLNGEGVLIQTLALQQALHEMSGGDLAFWPMALSRELARSGKTMVWKPEVVCGTRAKPVQTDAIAAQMFMAQNLSWLASNGSYNPRLSLKKPALVDAQRTTPWLDLAPDIKRLMLLQEESAQFPAVHLPALAQLGETGKASTTLWTVSSVDSADVLVLEIVRAGPHAVYFGAHATNGILAKALALLARLCPSVRRICCVGPATKTTTEGEFWELLDWLHRHLHALRLAHKGLVGDETQAETLRPHHPDLRLVDSTASSCSQVSGSGLQASYSDYEP